MIFTEACATGLPFVVPKGKYSTFCGVARCRTCRLIPRLAG
jgi:hypothetical protein